MVNHTVAITTLDHAQTRLSPDFDGDGFLVRLGPFSLVFSLNFFGAGAAGN